jgi:hypothetical protein
MAKNAELFFLYLLIVFISSYDKYLFGSFTRFVVGLFVLLMFNYFSSSHILDISLILNECHGFWSLRLVK